jgi:hypothetical protein
MSSQPAIRDCGMKPQCKWGAIILLFWNSAKVAVSDFSAVVPVSAVR